MINKFKRFIRILKVIYHKECKFQKTAWSDIYEYNKDNGFW